MCIMRQQDQVHMWNVLLSPTCRPCLQLRYWWKNRNRSWYLYNTQMLPRFSQARFHRVRPSITYTNILYYSELNMYNSNMQMTSQRRRFQFCHLLLYYYSSNKKAVMIMYYVICPLWKLIKISNVCHMTQCEPESQYTKHGICTGIFHAEFCIVQYWHRLRYTFQRKSCSSVYIWFYERRINLKHWWD